LLFGSMAEPLGAEVTYQLALCWQERAERLQLRRELEQRAGAAAPTAAQDAWWDALSSWKEYIRGWEPGRPASMVARQWVASARVLQARARAAHGQPAEAVADLKALAQSDKKSGVPITDLERLAAAWLARQLEGKK
jgi:hypothetical protein